MKFIKNKKFLIKNKLILKINIYTITKYINILLTLNLHLRNRQSHLNIFKY